MIKILYSITCSKYKNILFSIQSSNKSNTKVFLHHIITTLNSYKQYKTQHCVLQLDTHLTLTFNICMTKQKCYHCIPETKRITNQPKNTQIEYIFENEYHLLTNHITIPSTHETSQQHDSYSITMMSPPHYTRLHLYTDTTYFSTCTRSYTADSSGFVDILGSQ